MVEESYRGRIFTIADPDARLRKSSALDEFITKPNGGIATIANGTKVSVSAVTIVPAGSETVAIFVHAHSANGANDFGWTSANNLRGKFLSETVGKIPPPARASRFGPHAVWANGQYLQQTTLIRLVGTRKEIEHISEVSCAKFLEMVAAARDDGIMIGVNSCFRSYPQQKQLYEGFKANRPGYNPANPPGMSNHQNGIAFDLDVGGGGSNPTYVWLIKNATRFGFLRTVSREAWHWEYIPQKAAQARARGSFHTWL